MKCAACNADVAPGAQFCQKCGAKLPGAADAGTPTAAAGEVDVASMSPAARMRPRNIRDVPEEVLWEGGYSPKAMIGSWTGAVVFSVLLLVAAVFLLPAGPIAWAPLGVVVVIWIFLLGRYAAMRLGVHYKLTNRQFFHIRGILSRTTNRVEVIDIDDVAFEQSLVDRMFGVGRIKITSSDKSDPVLWLNGIEKVEEVSSMIDAARRAERLRRGVSVEAV